LNKLIIIPIALVGIVALWYYKTYYVGRQKVSKMLDAEQAVCPMCKGVADPNPSDACRQCRIAYRKKINPAAFAGP